MQKKKRFFKIQFRIRKVIVMSQVKESWQTILHSMESETQLLNKSNIEEISKMKLPVMMNLIQMLKKITKYLEPEKLESQEG